MRSTHCITSAMQVRVYKAFFSCYYYSTPAWAYFVMAETNQNIYQRFPFCLHEELKYDHWDCLLRQSNEYLLRLVMINVFWVIWKLSSTPEIKPRLLKLSKTVLPNVLPHIIACLRLQFAQYRDHLCALIYFTVDCMTVQHVRGKEAPVIRIPSTSTIASAKSL